MMKKWIFVLFAAAIFMPDTALAQHSSKAAEAKQTGLKASKVFTKAVTIAGEVSLDRRTLVSEENDIWRVSNPNVLAGHKGKLVLVKCQVHSDKNEIEVFSVKDGVAEAKYIARNGDSAFRR
jgi:hypothetical protein